jgi:hypothetical protein
MDPKRVGLWEEVVQLKMDVSEEEETPQKKKKHTKKTLKKNKKEKRVYRERNRGRVRMAAFC